MRKASKGEFPDAATTTTAAGTATKRDPHEGSQEAPLAVDLERQESGSRLTNLTASAPARRTSQRDPALYTQYVDIAGQTQKFGAFKAATTVGVRTNGFAQSTYPSQVWEQQATQQSGTGMARTLYGGAKK